MDFSLERTAWESFISIRKKDPNCRDAFYEHCREFFVKNCDSNNKKDEIALHLFAFLASWGMLRNPFMMQKDYLFHREVVDILCESQYKGLLFWEPLDNTENDSMVELVIKLKERIVDAYKGKIYYKDFDPGKDPKPHPIGNVTDTLSSKIILGTFGCVPAYDQNLLCSLKDYKSKDLSADGLKTVIGIAQENKSYIKECKEELKECIPEVSHLYTTMKIVDILLWGKGARMKQQKE